MMLMYGILGMSRGKASIHFLFSQVWCMSVLVLILSLMLCPPSTQSTSEKEAELQKLFQLRWVSLFTFIFIISSTSVSLSGNSCFPPLVKILHFIISSCPVIFMNTLLAFLSFRVLIFLDASVSLAVVILLPHTSQSQNSHSEDFFLAHEKVWDFEE